MRKDFVKLALSLVMGFPTTTAIAGAQGDALGKCLVRHASAADTKILTQWAFVTVGQTQAAREIVTIPKAKVAATTEKAQRIVVRLLAKDCAQEALKATLYEGKGGISNGVQYAVMQYMTREMH